MQGSFSDSFLQGDCVFPAFRAESLPEAQASFLSYSPAAIVQEQIFLAPSDGPVVYALLKKAAGHCESKPVTMPGGVTIPSGPVTTLSIPDVHFDYVAFQSTNPSQLGGASDSEVLDTVDVEVGNELIDVWYGSPAPDLRGLSQLMTAAVGKVEASPVAAGAARSPGERPGSSSSAQQTASWPLIGGGFLFGLMGLWLGVGAWRGKPVGFRANLERTERNWSRSAVVPAAGLIPGGMMFICGSAALASANLSDRYRSGIVHVLGLVLFLIFVLAAILAMILVFSVRFGIGPRWLYPARHRGE